MAKNLILLTPLPQFRFTGRGVGQRRFIIDDTMLIQPLRPRLRAAMYNMAEKRRSTPDVRKLVKGSGLVYLATVPTQWHVPKVDPTEAFNYCPIASEILNKLHDCLLLFASLPAPLAEPPWFSAEAEEAYDESWKIKKINVIDLLHPRWTYTHQPTNIDWRSSKPVDIDLKHFSGNHRDPVPYWGRIFRGLMAVDDLYFQVDSRKTGALSIPAEEYAKQKLNKFIKDNKDEGKWGPDATISWPSDKNAPRIPKVYIGPGREPVDLTSCYDQYFSEGHRKALHREIKRRSGRLHDNPPENRLARAFQFFCESFRLTEPFRFVGFATCLEALFCTSRAEITFQLACRLSWLLEPNDFAKRQDTFEKTKKLYDLRSQIVHGGPFTPDKIDAHEGSLVELCRRVFRTIFGDDELCNTFFSDVPQVCHKYLDSLNLGGAQPRNG